MSEIIKPTIGRKVWFRPNGTTNLPVPGKDTGGRLAVISDQPLDATVTYVWSDRMVNLSVLDHYGNPFIATSVTMLQPDDVAPTAGFYAEWMPYQTGQARKDAAIDRVINMNTPLGAVPAPVAAAQAQSTIDFLAGSKACDIADGTCEACQ